MSLQRIFSSTTIIVGLFISVDYGLCDEFRCRGREVSAHVTTVKGSWGVKAIWTFVYVGALAAFAMFFTLLEGHYTTEVIVNFNEQKYPCIQVYILIFKLSLYPCIISLYLSHIYIQVFSIYVCIAATEHPYI